MENLFFVVFIVLIIGILVFDLRYVGKESHVLSFREAVIWSVVWITLSMLFAIFLYFYGNIIHGIDNFKELSEEISKYAVHLKIVPGDFEGSLQLYRTNLAITFITGYVIEKTLSIDNIFVMLLILSAFSVKEKNYKHVLFWGILGAIILRCLFIFGGAALVQRFHWILILFGLFLVYSGVKMYLDRNKDEKIEPQKHPLVKFLSKHFAVFPRYVADYFFVRRKGKLFVTPLFIVLILVEFTDLIFAFDSIPAIFAISTDPYVVFYSNIFAIIGLRALFFLLIKVIDKFHYLKIGVAVLLVFIGMKLLLGKWLDDYGFMPIHSLIIILFVLTASIIASILIPHKDPGVA